MRIVLSIFLLSLLHQGASAQDYAADMKKIMAWFGPKNLQINAVYQAYAKPEDPKPLETMESVLLKQDTLQYLKLGFLEMVRGANFGININGKDKTIILQNNSPQVKSLDLAAQMDFSRLLQLCSKVELNKISDQTSALYLFFSQGQYKQLTVYFHPKTYQPSKVETIYTVTGKGVFASSSASKLVITYKQITANPKFDSHVFQKATYVQKQQNSWKAQEKFKNFTVTLVDNTQQQQ